MLKVIVNTSPLQYLFQLNKMDTLNQVYESITVPLCVQQEISTGIKNGVSLPKLESYNWLTIESSKNTAILQFPSQLGKGEKEVIALGFENKNSILILDDYLARQYAKAMDLTVTGTIGVLLKAKKLNLFPKLKPILDELVQLGFRISKETYNDILLIAGE